jgi:hypothetical protein
MHKNLIGSESAADTALNLLNTVTNGYRFPDGSVAIQKKSRTPT